MLSVMAKERLDQSLVRRGLFSSRERAQRAVMAGLVQVDGALVDKSGTRVATEAEITVKGAAEPFVSRAGRKLAHALDHFDLSPAGKTCMDVGASTGGFTDCMLQRGAIRIYAIDVGYGQLDHRLRTDPRVVVMERLNARYLRPDAVPEPCELITVDVSFISVIKIVPALLPHLAEGGRLIVLLKPQFEAGRNQVGKGGIVRDENVRSAVLADRVGELTAMGLGVDGPVDSRVVGMRGNREAFVLLKINEGGRAR